MRGATWHTGSSGCNTEAQARPQPKCEKTPLGDESRLPTEGSFLLYLSREAAQSGQHMARARARNVRGNGGINRRGSADGGARTSVRMASPATTLGPLLAPKCSDESAPHLTSRNASPFEAAATRRNWTAPRATSSNESSRAPPQPTLLLRSAKAHDNAGRATGGRVHPASGRSVPEPSSTSELQRAKTRETAPLSNSINPLKIRPPPGATETSTKA